MRENVRLFIIRVRMKTVTKENFINSRIIKLGKISTLNLCVH